MSETSIGQTQPLVPAYYWAGDGSAFVHRLKGFTYGIDEPAYRHAYDRERLRWLRQAFGVNFVFLSYNWGLPTEMEHAHWAAFESAARHSHALGMQVAAYVQPSNAVSVGSYAQRDWYAVTPKGKRIPYYNGRFFTCLNHPGWRAEVFSRVRGALAAGADAIFLDNCAFGGMPIPLNRGYTAFAGCYCDRCQKSFLEWQRAREQPPSGIPRFFRPDRDPVAREFAHWRAWTLTAFLREIRDEIRRANPAAALLANTVGAVNLNTYNVFGVDLPEVAQVVDWLFVENLQSPRAGAGMLIQNAGTFKLLSALRPGAPTLSISYERGIGVDGVPGTRTFERTMAEGYAAGGVPVVRLGEYIEDGRWTILQPRQHQDRAAAARRVVDFVAAHGDVFSQRSPASPVAVYVPPGLAWRGDIFPEHDANYLAVMQALVRAAIPFRVVTDLGDLRGVRALLVPAGARRPKDFAGAVLAYHELGIARRRRSLFDYLAFEPLIRRAGPWVVDGYYSRVYVRRFVDRLDLLFRLVFKDQFAPLDLAPSIASRLRALLPVRIQASGFVYVDLWENANGLQLHVVNYEDQPVTIRVHGPYAGRAEPIEPLRKTADGFELRNYAIFQIANVAEPATAPAAAAVR